jgi:hypothetical protein
MRPNRAKGIYFSKKGELTTGINKLYSKSFTLNVELYQKEDTF